MVLGLQRTSKMLDVVAFGQIGHGRTGVRLRSERRWDGILACRPVDIVPPESQDFSLAAAGQHQQTDRRHRRREHRDVGLRLVQHRAKTAELPAHQEPLARRLRIAPHEPARIRALRPVPPGLGQRQHLAHVFSW